MSEEPKQERPSPQQPIRPVPEREPRPERLPYERPIEGGDSGKGTRTWADVQDTVPPPTPKEK